MLGKNSGKTATVIADRPNSNYTLFSMIVLCGKKKHKPKN